ncbi:MAG: HAMP domain-containing protein [Deltaproteobacteria bacterium]|nr:HAMP domain-containing protein [Deltaproteobacteria bacterium]
MRLGSRIVAFVVVPGVMPLVLVAYMAGQIARDHLEDTMRRAQVEVAVQLADGVGRALDDLERVLSVQAGNFQLDVATDEARGAFLLATWRLFPEIAIAALVDSEGQDLVPPVYASSAGEAGAHDHVDARRLADFQAGWAVPTGPVSRGAPYVPAGSGAAVMPISFLSPHGDGLVLYTEVSLRPIARQLARVAGDDRSVALVDLDGEVLVAAGSTRAIDPARLAPVLRSSSSDARVDDEAIVATAAVEGRDMAVVVTSAASFIDQAVDGVRRPTWFIGLVALVAMAVGGRIIGKSITEPVDQLRAAAQAVGEGDLRQRVRLAPGDELGELGHSFDQMTERLEANLREIAEQSAIIDRYNRELERLVSERTAQLVETQEQLVQSRQLAAVAEMSAGLAHELNNPLAGVLGLLQILKQLRVGQADAALLGSAEEQAIRCKEIVASLLRFTAQPRGEGEQEQVDLGGIVRDVVGLAGSAFRQREVGLELDCDTAEIPVLAHPDELGRALSQVLAALRAVAAPGSTLSIAAGRVKGEMAARAEVRFSMEAVVDNEDDWRASALGLWAARQVLVMHEARLDEVAVASGRAWRLVVPLAPGAA